jgi:hypothetical protein
VNDVDEMLIKAKEEQGIEENILWGDTIPEQIAKKPGSLKAMAESIAKAGKKQGFDTSDVAETLAGMSESSIFSEESRDLAASLVGVLRNMAANEEKKLPATPAGVDEKEAMTLATSSLQAIGGGDIGSIMSGFHVDIQQEQLDVQREIAANTAPSPNGAGKTIVNVAK